MRDGGQRKSNEDLDGDDPQQDHYFWEGQQGEATEAAEGGDGETEFVPEPISPVTIPRKAQRSGKTLWGGPDEQDDRRLQASASNSPGQSAGPSPRSPSPKSPKLRSPTSPSPKEQSEERHSSKDAKPKKLQTYDSVIIRSATREGWDPIVQQPFAMRRFHGKQLEQWTCVNVGQLLGFASQKGGQPHVPNQDEFAVLHEAGYQIYVVLDGHGRGGESVAKFSRQWLCNALLNLVRQRNGKVLGAGELPKIFDSLQEALQLEEARGVKSQCQDLRESGCSGLIAILTPTRSLRGVWLGDCECIAGRRAKDGAQPPTLVALTTPHVQQGKVTRALGRLANVSISHTADEFMEADIDLSSLDFIVLGSGGLWRGVNKAAVLEEITKAGPYHAQHAAVKLATASQESQMVASEQTGGPFAVQDATMLVAWIGSNIPV